MDDKDKIKQDSYLRAREKVNKIKKFYRHLSIYIVVCSAVTIMGMVNDYIDTGIIVYDGGIWLFWGIGILFHAFRVFGSDIILGKGWEQKKTKELMDEDNF